MFNAIVKSLFYYEMVLVGFGIFILFMKKQKVGIVLFAISVFCISWRFFSYDQTSRYYSALILFGLFLSASAVYYVISFFKSSPIRNYFIILVFTSLLFFQLSKCFFSFRNIYVLDLQDSVKTILENEPQNDIVIMSNEHIRLQGNKKNDGKIDSLLHERYDLTALYIEKGSFVNSLYLIVSNDTLPLSFENRKKDYSNYTSIQKKEIEHHLSNDKHTKFVSVYKHFPYMPLPDIAPNPILDSAVLKVYIPEYDAYIYLKNNVLLWLVGTTLKPKTEMIIHVSTNQPDLLPEKRKQYKFDNLGFQINENSKQRMIGHYLIFEKALPSSYHITNLRVGFNENGKVIARTIFL